MAEHNDLGKWGEQVAVDYLQRKGYEILERDWKSGHRDLDIIALDGDTVEGERAFGADGSAARWAVLPLMVTPLMLTVLLLYIAPP